MVIAIIGILAALLLPALQQAKQQAKIILCTSNQKQIGLAIANYANDYNEYMPTAYRDSSKAIEVSYDDLLAGYDGRKLTNAEILDWVSPPKSDSYKLYKCPAMQNSRYPAEFRSYSMSGDYSAWPDAGDPADKDGRCAPGSFGWGSSNAEDLNGGWFLPWSRKISSIKLPDSVIMVTEYLSLANTMGTCLDTSATSWKITEYFSPNGSQITNAAEGGRVTGWWVHGTYNLNFMYVDGHVKFKPYVDTVSEGASGATNKIKFFAGEAGTVPEGTEWDANRDKR